MHITINIGESGEQPPAVAYSPEGDGLTEREKERIYEVCRFVAKHFGLYSEMCAFLASRQQKKTMRDLPDCALEELLAHLLSLKVNIVKR